MDHWKKNSSLRYFAGLALLMVPVILMIIVPPAFARYQKEKNGNITFNVREPDQICFAKIEGTSFSVIEKQEDFVWTVSEDRKTKSLEISVANGSSKSSCASKDQRVAVRLIAGLDLSVTDGKTDITLECGGKVFDAKAEPVAVGSEFYPAIGEGWIITFVNSKGEEFGGLLKGGELNHFDVKITLGESFAEEEMQLITFAKIIN